MNVLLDPDMTLRDFLLLHCKRETDGACTYIPVEAMLKWDGATGTLSKVDPLDVPDEVVEALKLDGVI